MGSRYAALLSSTGFSVPQFVLEKCLPALTIPLPTDRAMKREHVYSKCIRCGWRQRSITVSGPVSFEEYYCKECGGQLLICVDVRNAKDRNKSNNGDKGHKRKKPKTENKASHHWSCCMLVTHLCMTDPLTQVATSWLLHILPKYFADWSQIYETWALSFSSVVNATPTGSFAGGSVGHPIDRGNPRCMRTSASCCITLCMWLIRSSIKFYLKIAKRNTRVSAMAI